MFQNLFFRSIGGMALFFIIELSFLLIGWGGKNGSDGWIVVALALHLVFTFLIFLNLAPLFGVAIAGYAGGVAPQTTSIGGQGAREAISWYVKTSMGVSHAITLLLMSLFFLDYQFSFVWFFLMLLILLGWAEYTLVFPTAETWAKRVSTTIMVGMTVVVVLVSLSPTISFFLTGRAFASNEGNAYKQAVMFQMEQQRNANKRKEEACKRLRDIVMKTMATNETELRATGQMNQGDLDICNKQVEVTTKWNAPALAVSGTSGAINWISASSWQEMAILAGIILGVLLLWRMLKSGGAPATTWKFPWRTILVLAALGLGTALLFYPTRSWIMEQIGNAKVGEMISGGERSISFAMTSLEPHRVCGLKRNTLYRLEGIKTSEGNKIPVTDRGNGSPFNSVPIGMTGGLEPDCPIQDRLYVWGILAGGKRIGEKFPTDAGGCTSVALNIGRVQKEGFILKERIGVELFLRE